MGKTQTLQKTTRQLAGNVGDRIEWPVRKRKPPRAMQIEWPLRRKQPRALQIGVVVGSLVVVTSALFAARSIRQAIRNR
jgi:hypothetical protein